VTAFPLDRRTEIYLGPSLGWVDITAYVFERDDVTITRGRSSEAAETERSEATLTLNARDGRFSSRNPMGPWYGLIGRNTPLRISIPGGDGRDYRFWGEVSSWPQQWDRSGVDVYTQVTASGILRRLSQGASPLRSALDRAVDAAAAGQYLQWWWPLETGGETTPPGFEGGFPMLVIGEVSFGQEGAPAGALGAASFEGELEGFTDPAGRLYQAAPTLTNDWCVAFWLDIPSPADLGATGISPMVTIDTANNGFGQWGFFVEPNGALHDAAIGRYEGDTSFRIADTRDLTGLHYFVLHAHQVGSEWHCDVHIDGEATPAVTHDPVATAAPVTSVSVNATIGPLAVVPTVKGSISWLMVSDSVALPDMLSYYQPGLGHAGETAGRRFERLCGEAGIAFTSIGDLDATEPMGPQRAERLLDLLTECAEADLGILYEPRNSLALGYRTRISLENQDPAAVLDYSAAQVTGDLQPLDDDQNTRNDFEVSRDGGSSARAVLESGPLSIQPPPDGVGRYDEALTVNVATDEQLADQAGWRLHLGTVDEARYPVLTVNLASSHIGAALDDDLLAVDIGDRVVVENPPPWMPPEEITQLVQGTTETLRRDELILTFNTSPESPWRVGVLDDAQARMDTDGSHLAVGVDADDTALSVTVTDGPLWTLDPAECPLDVRVGGEVMTVTAISDGVTDGFDRTVASGWGTAPDGQAWTVTGTASNYSVTGGEGRITFNATNAARVAALSQHCESVDVEVAFTLPVAAFTGSAAFLYLIGSYDQVGNDWYALVIILGTNGTISIFFERKTAGSVTSIGTTAIVPGITVNTTTTYRARLRVDDGLLQGKVWDAANPEPPTWHNAVADSVNPSAGDVGVQVFVPAGVTNPLPLTFAFLEMVVHNPQTFTVTRGTNGITKAHTAGTDVRLAVPTTITF
jgi:hypothetical protein